MTGTFATPEDWGPEDYAKWMRRISVFFSERGAKLDKLVLSSDMEVKLMGLHMRYGDSVVSVNEKAVIHLLGVPIRFTNKLPWHKAMFLCSDMKEAA